MRERVCPPTLEKSPPAYTVPLLTARARTAPFALAFQAVAFPVVGSNAAMEWRVCPPMLVKLPPAYTVPLLTARASTGLFAFGFHPSSVPSARTCATFARGTPATWVKVPPTYHPPAPSAATAATGPFTRGQPDRDFPFTASMAAKEPVFGLTMVRPNTGSFAAIDAVNGKSRSGWPRVNGPVAAVAADGAGGWYVGGTFTQVAGVPRANVAHVRADGTLDGWNPNANSPVLALAVSNGTVYAGGSFTSIGGQTRHSIAALDPATGNATAWNANANGAVLALAVSNGTVYAGGDFSSVGGQTRSRIAALDTMTAQ